MNGLCSTHPPPTPRDEFCSTGCSFYCLAIYNYMYFGTLNLVHVSYVILLTLLQFWKKEKLRFLPSLFGPGDRGRGSLTTSNLIKHAANLWWRMNDTILMPFLGLDKWKICTRTSREQGRSCWMYAWSDQGNGKFEEDSICLFKSSHSCWCITSGLHFYCRKEIWKMLNKEMLWHLCIN